MTQQPLPPTPPPMPFSLPPGTFGSALRPDDPRPPTGRQGAYDFAGFQPENHIMPDGGISPAFELRWIVRLRTPYGMTYAGSPVSRIAVHSKAAGPLEQALEEIAAAGLWPGLRIYAGGFCPRLTRGANSLSMHTLGLALDFNPDQNPLGADPATTFFGGTESGRRTVAIFYRWGWFWGGFFNNRKDPMHFQFCTGV